MSEARPQSRVVKAETELGALYEPPRHRQVQDAGAAVGNEARGGQTAICSKWEQGGSSTPPESFVFGWVRGRAESLTEVGRIRGVALRPVLSCQRLFFGSESENRGADTHPFCTYDLKKPLWTGIFKERHRGNRCESG